MSTRIKVKNKSKISKLFITNSIKITVQESLWFGPNHYRLRGVKNSINSKNHRKRHENQITYLLTLANEIHNECSNIIIEKSQIRLRKQSIKKR
jgi:hypothetical protein